MRFPDMRQQPFYLRFRALLSTQDISEDFQLLLVFVTDDFYQKHDAILDTPSDRFQLR